MVPCFGIYSTRRSLQDHAKQLVNSWLSFAQASDQQHLLGKYGDQSSWAMLYNVYADLLMQTNLIPRDVSHTFV